MENFEIISKPREIYKSMLKDIENAKRSIYLETYIYDNDEIGKKFTRVLLKKAKEGIKISILIDAFGAGNTKGILSKTLKLKKSFGVASGVDLDYFSEIIKYGGNVRFFREIRYVLRLFGQNHERNHRKLLIVDDKISYLGSANITMDCIDWRELVLRSEGPIARDLISSFTDHWNLAGKVTKKKIKLILHKGFEIIQDLPSDAKMITADRYIRLIRSAKKEILIETPYFVPPIRIRQALARAVERGVKVKILLPCKSNYQVLDIIRNRYLGRLFRKGIEINYYTPSPLHSKLLIVDDKFFILGSSNLDYRCLIHQYEINLLGRDKMIISKLKEFYDSGLKKSKPFIYNEWRSRSSFTKMAEMIISLVENYL
jgi:cardiolipin synthase A/B